MNYPGQVEINLLAHTLSNIEWNDMENTYNSNNNNRGTLVVQSEVIGTFVALHLLTKLDNGEFERNFIFIDENFAHHYRYM